MTPSSSSTGCSCNDAGPASGPGGSRGEKQPPKRSGGDELRIPPGLSNAPKERTTTGKTKSGGTGRQSGDRMMASRMAKPAEPWQEPVRGDVMPPAVMNLSGMDQILAWDRGYVPMPPLAHLTGIRMSAVGEGTSTFTMPASPWFLAPQGAITIGMLAVLADPPLGCAIQTTLPAATPYTTAELSLTAVRPVAGTGGLLSAHGNVVHPGRRMALSEVAIEDDAGRLVAHGTSRCMVLPDLRRRPPVQALELLAPPDNTGDPWLRPVMGEVLPQALWDCHDGLDILRLLLAGDAPRPPISYLTGLRLTAAEPGSATFLLPASGWLGSPTGNLEGGFIAMLADAALQSAIQTTAPAGCAIASLDLKVNFLRPAPTDGRDLVGVGTVVHRGRSLVIANAEVVNAEGRRVALATGSTLLLPGHRASLDDTAEFDETQET